MTAVVETSMREVLDSLCRGEHLPFEQSRALFDRLIAGELSEVEIAAFLVALKAKGETPDEVAGAASALRQAAAGRLSWSLPAVADTCGTGGDGANTLNISTAAAVVAAECGVAVAKHGNRAVSSQCGCADVLERCGVRIDAPSEVSEHALRELNICFLYAPQYHAGMQRAAPVRRALKTRTIFNLVGPLVNPAAPRWQLLGVHDPALCVPMAQTLSLMGCEAALVVHGSGIDEIALHGPTRAARLTHGDIVSLTLEPQSLGLHAAPLDELRGGSPESNADWLQRLLEGGGVRSHMEAVAANAGALLWITRTTESSLAICVDECLETLHRGAAAERLAKWAAMTQSSSQSSS